MDNRVSVVRGGMIKRLVTVAVAGPLINASRLRGLGVAAQTRSAVAPQVPTMQEAGVASNEALQWNGFFAPAGTPQTILDRLHREVVKALAAPEVRQRFEAEGAEPAGSTPAEFAAFYRAEAEKWADVAKRSGTKLD